MSSAARSASKSQRYSIAQRDHLIQFLESHSMFAAGKFSGKEGKDKLRHMWDTLTKELNSIIGATKDCSQWQTVWRDLKHKVSKRVSEIRTEQQRSTGNLEWKHPPLTPYEMRIAGIIGPEYVQGSSTCPDSIPETEMQLERLETGDDSVFDEEPQVFTVCVTDPKTCSRTNDEMEESHYELENLARDLANSHNETEEFDFDDTTVIAEKANQTTGPSSDAGPSTSNAVTPASKGATPSIKKMCKRTKKASRVRIGTQLQEARTNFQQLCTSNNKSMEMLAEATMKQAEAASIQAEAASVQAKAALIHARNETDRIKVFTKLTDVLEKALEKFS